MSLEASQKEQSGPPVAPGEGCCAGDMGQLATPRETNRTMAEAPTARRAVVIAAEEAMSDSQAWIPVRRTPIHVPPGHPRADHDVAYPGRVIGGVCLEGELEELVRLAASAFPPILTGPACSSWDVYTAKSTLSALVSWAIPGFGRSTRSVAPRCLSDKVMQTRLSRGQNPRVWPTNLRTSAGGCGC